MRYLAVIPARGGSKGIPKKNVALVAGKPLIAWTIEAALECKLIEKVVVSTDSAEIAEVAKKYGAEVIMRPAELAGDSTPTAPVLAHALSVASEQGFTPDAIVTLQPTSPLRRSFHLSEAIALFEAHPEADSLVSVTQVPHHMGPASLMDVDGVWGTPTQSNPILRRQDKPAYWCRNGAAVYITKASRVGEYVWGGKTLVFPMSKISSIDVDDAEDLRIADALLKAGVDEK
jgi:CMP-N-acetylneuraminic acid synthetase